MKPIFTLIAIITSCLAAYLKSVPDEENIYITNDIPHFWQAVDALKEAKTTEDSVRVVQTLYLDRMSKEGKKFLQIRRYTAPEYVRTIRKYPKYLRQLRYKTDNLPVNLAALDHMFEKMKGAIPEYRLPKVCFAVGCIRGGGTVDDNVILLGAEIALTDSSMDFSEFKAGALRDILSKGINLTALVAHESIHCQQHHGKTRNLLSVSLKEGSADFLPALILKEGYSTAPVNYGMAHECELWRAFEPNINSGDLSEWLFNAGSIQNKPADLGYFVGLRICEAYYNKQSDKQNAIKNILDLSKFAEIMEQSGYNGGCK